MSEKGRIYEVPWNSREWERAILERQDIARIGGPGDWVLYRPSRLLVRTRALRDKRVKTALQRAGAERAGAGVAEVAKALGYTLFVVRDDRLVSLVRRIRSYVAHSASLDHVQLPGPNRVHGDDLPVPIEGPLAIPGEGAAGDGLTVLVLDTGCADKVPFAVTMTPADAEVADEDADNQRDPAAGHGTHVAGVVASLAPGATIVARRLLTTPVGQASDLDVAAALLDHGGADVINCSFGSTALNDAPPIVIEDALAALPTSTVVVAAAGNAGTSRPDYPAACNGVVAVGAVGSPKDDGTWLQTDFSNHGIWVDCCAPGVAIASTFLDRPDLGFAGFATWTGTSMAAPAVSATIAALATRSAITVQQAAAQLRALPPLGTIGALVVPADVL
jgi:subtilisin family serine protease